ncbi:hypothetical protein B296_00038922 [Ensete ventricosum]|uniref:Fe2OG dioxygenase domain-containing protein n=1 Tax=Ensete ventricosum TaxID=4639 RepID=A0A426ZV11_ENSVE|nr:hypothetical protein B296_00038922 [Ensete ventricosum]
MLQAFNILRYEIGQRYASHYDAFNPAEYGPQKSQRVCTKLCCGFSLLTGGNRKTSLHGSCSVVKGEKWVATKWIRDQIDK